MIRSQKQGPSENNKRNKNNENNETQYLRLLIIIKKKVITRLVFYNQSLDFSSLQLLSVHRGQTVSIKKAYEIEFQASKNLGQLDILVYQIFRQRYWIKIQSRKDSKGCIKLQKLSLLKERWKKKVDFENKTQIEKKVESILTLEEIQSYQNEQWCHFVFPNFARHILNTDFGTQSAAYGLRRTISFQFQDIQGSREQFHKDQKIQISKLREENFKLIRNEQNIIHEFMMVEKRNEE
ncbi:unnamed protein product [Paramecium pentaurelia]|uniref:Uncharacterized protein n=1 Tax=Paramecium pentaurelia TaxID=43138 RepID=A0A8S1V6I8_9CILI|nr:unnamed protein product [Paramecium pentaurelia]